MSDKKTMALFDIVDQTPAWNDWVAFNKTEPQYHGLLKAKDLQFLLVKSGNGRITFVNMTTGRGELYTGKAGQWAFLYYMANILHSAEWVEVIDASPAVGGYNLFMRRGYTPEPHKFVLRIGPGGVYKTLE